ncbi:MAG: hypothetical protein SCARUB_01623 [Candidatus Scalindua rubra]|uniref:Uncharacterized protein n=1 Tax=Candidatus Scalindua rubra TaxID=1872076 RepID=A0A1E3XC76_9BACT|nr:MAG: hypothetical protein SCARUB_01623 [Candidatus Scalindua rubra]
MGWILSQLSPSEILEQDQKIHKYSETQMMMKVTERSFFKCEDS